MSSSPLSPVPWRLVVAACVAACVASLGCTEKTRTTDTRSSAFAAAKERNAFLCAYIICSTAPLDSAYHLVFHDNSGGLVPGSSDYDIQAVVKVAPDDVAQWRKGCSPKRVDAKPPWFEAVISEPGWRPTTVPDTYLCGPNERRIVHVREGLIILWAKSGG